MYAFFLKFVLNFKVTNFLFVCLFPVVAESKEQVFQSPTVDSLEGAVAEISCNHSMSNVYGFFWYLHFPGFAPRLLIKGSKPSQQGRYNMTYERFSSSLLILQVQPADAGVYYCALRCTEAGHPWRAEQKQGEVRAFAGCGRKMNNNCFPAYSQFSIPQAFPFALSGKTFESKHYIQWASLVAHLVMSLQCRRPRFDSWVGKIPWRRERLPTPVFWPGEVAKSQTRMSDFHFTFKFISRHIIMI